MTMRFTRRTAFEYAVALASVAVFVGLRRALDPILGDVAPLIFFLLPVAFSAWFGGFGPGMLATIVAMYVGVARFASNGRAPAPTPPHGPAFFWLARGVPFTLVGGIISLFASRLEAARAQARRAEQQQRLIFASVRDFSIFPTDLDGRIETWSVGAERLFGYADAEAIGRAADELFTPEDRAADAPAAERRAAARDGSASDDRWHLRKDGGRFFASGALTALHDRGGLHVGFTKVARDVTERRRIEEGRERLLASEQALRESAELAGRMKDEFLATISHELRTPLSAIVGWSGLLLSGRKRDEATIAEGLNVIARNASAQSQLIEDILDMSRITSGKVRLAARPLDVREPIRAAIATVETAARAKDIAIVEQLGDAPAIVTADPDRLQQVFWNLLGNAIKFSARGRPVMLTLRVEASRLFVDVADQGNGMAPEVVAYVFDRFRQADMSTTRRHGGLGLGLSIVRHLIELHGGSIRASSEGVGRGSTFVVELPFATVADRAVTGDGKLPVLPADAAAIECAANLDGIRVLVVDDHVDARRAIEAALEQCGATTTAAGSAAEAIDAVRASARFDLILSDIGMPDADGYEFLGRLRRLEAADGRAARVPVVALTAYTRATDRQAVLDAGFDQYLAKPVEPAVLLETLSQLLRSLGVARDPVAAIDGRAK